MPLSIWLGLEDCLKIITEQKPKSVLDAGIGFGLWGHLLRQYLDVWCGRITREQWQIRIDGIEIYENRVQPHSRYLYNEVYIGDIRKMVPDIAAQRPYDIIFYGDVLEHLPKEDALQLIKQSIAMAAKMVVIRIPLGDQWRKQGREPPDHHLSEWVLEDFQGFVANKQVYHFWGHPYALVAIDARETFEQSLANADVKLRNIEARLAGFVDDLSKGELR